MDVQSDTFFGGVSRSSWPPRPFLGVLGAPEPAPLKLASFREELANVSPPTFWKKSLGKRRWPV
eukprot:14458047-Alexandrium_andersonii.AAC.1